MKGVWKVCSLGLLALTSLYLSGLLTQLMESIAAWREMGSPVDIAPVLPSLSPQHALLALFHVPLSLLPLGLCTLLLLFLAVKWRTEKEGGFTIADKDTYGSADFMKRREVRENFHIAMAEKTDGDILGMLPRRQVLTLPPDSRLNNNIAICGASGTGKSRSVSRNLILQAARRGESLVITDPKSELYESTAAYLRDQGYTVRVFNLVEMGSSDSWNCLKEIEGSELNAQTFADVVLKTTSSDPKDAFWYSAELNLLKALILYVSIEMPPEKQCFATVFDLLSKKTEHEIAAMMKNVSTYHVHRDTGEILPPCPAGPSYALFSQASEAVRNNLIIGLGSKLGVFQSREVRSITSHDEIDLELPGREKCAYFCIVSDQDNTFEFLSSLFFSFLFIRLIRYADTQCPGGVLPVPVRFVLDEFPNCCLIKDFTKKCSTIRSRGVSVACFFQNVGQMKNRYPNEQWQEIIGACDTLIFLGCTDSLTADFISSRLGISSIEVEGRSSESKSVLRTSTSPGRRPLMTSDEVLRFPTDEELLFIRGKKPVRVRRFDYSLHPAYPLLRRERAVEHMPQWRLTDDPREDMTDRPLVIPIEKQMRAAARRSTRVLGMDP